MQGGEIPAKKEGGSAHAVRGNQLQEEAFGETRGQDRQGHQKRSSQTAKQDRKDHNNQEDRPACEPVKSNSSLIPLTALQVDQSKAETAEGFSDLDKARIYAGREGTAFHNPGED